MHQLLFQRGFLSALISSSPRSPWDAGQELNAFIGRLNKDLWWLGMAVAFSLLELMSSGHAQTPTVPPPVPKFEDTAVQAGLIVPHISSLEKQSIIESMSGGVGFIDCDNDGKLDIVTVNGSNVDRYLRGGDPMVTLYH